MRKMVYYQNNEKERKPRLFVDMDGTVAEWRQIKLKIDNEESISSEHIQKRIHKILMQPGYFYTLRPHQNVIDAINQIIQDNKIEVFVLSCCLADDKTTGVSPEEQKNAWLDKYMPEIDQSHRIFVPDGQRKQDYIKSPNQETDFLLDDYTHNLNQWITKENGIKLLNNVNHTKKTWSGNKVDYLDDAKTIANKITDIIENKIKEKEQNLEDERDF